MSDRPTAAVARTRLVAVLAPAVGLALGLALALAGCATISDQLAEDDVDPGDVAVAAEALGTSSSASLLETVGWGELDGLVSVIVRNPTTRLLRRAEAVITLRDARGTVLVSSAPGATRTSCCTVHSLPPGELFGVYVDAGAAAGDVAEVEVTYRDVSWRAGPLEPAPEAVPVRVVEGTRGAVVVADVTTTEEVPSATVQARLADPDGDVLAVVSGTWHCFREDATRRIWMELFRPVPEGSVVESVSVHPDGAARDSCTDAPAS